MIFTYKQYEKHDHKFFVSLFELWFSIPVNSFDHVGTLPPFLGLLPKIRIS